MIPKSSLVVLDTPFEIMQSALATPAPEGGDADD